MHAMAAVLSPSPDHRRRLLDAMAQAVARKGFGETTIADLAAEARVSRRTFYEHFADKADCVIALYEVASAQALQVLKASIDPRRDWRTQVDQALSAYLSTLSCNPTLLSTLFIAILGLGPAGLAARRRANNDLADFILGVVNDGSRADPLAPQMALAIVGGVNELILQAIEQGRAAQLIELSGAAARLARSVIDG
jgi:AcrR family transcriptional regulator